MPVNFSKFSRMHCRLILNPDTIRHAQRWKNLSMFIVTLLLVFVGFSPALAKDRTTIAVVGLHQDTLLRDAQVSSVADIADAIEKNKKFDYSMFHFRQGLNLKLMSWIHHLL